MFETFRNAWKIEDLRKRLMYTLLILVLFRVGCAITVPYINPAVLSTFFSGTEMLGYLNMMSGGALSQCAVFALGVSPYINASIIIQLLTVAIPALENLAKEGEEGRRKITRITHYTAMGIAFVMSIGYYFILRRMGALHYTSGWENWFSAVVIILTFTAGSQLITWMGEQIDSKGIGNGVSILIFAGIVSRWTDINTIAHNIAVQVESGNWLYSLVGIGMVVAMLFAVWFVSYSDGAERRIPVQYAARKYNARGQASYIPVKLLMSGVMPIIFAGVIMSIPATVDMFVDATKHVRLHSVLSVFSSGSWIYYAVYVILIALFNFFYIEIQFDAVSISSNLRNQGGAVPGYRPGPQTTEMLNKALHKMAQTGSFYLAIIALMPMVLSLISGTQISFGGTSLMIMSSVALEVVRSMEGYLTVRHHKGFLG